jgi:ABC-2 type transport system permease protein
LGPALIAFWVNLMVTGWAIGLAVSAMVLRFGLGVESLAWVMVFAIAPLAGIYYPIDTLPVWLRPIAWALPPAHVFDGLRTLMQSGVFDWTRLVHAIGLNLFYVAAAAALFLRTHHVARQRGLLLNVGE